MAPLAAAASVPASLISTNALLMTAERNNSSRSEEHTSELQSLRHLVCRLLLEKKNENYRGLTFKYALINQPLMVPEILTAVALLIVFSRTQVLTGHYRLGSLITAHTSIRPTIV